MQRWMRRCVGALLAATIPVTLLATAGTSVAAEGPAEIKLSGHGFGHGRGMGQWGARGYAEAGWSASRILDHFYGGTAAGTRPDAGLRVLLCDLEGVTICTTGPGIDQITVTSSAAFHFEGIQNAFPAGTAVRVTRDHLIGQWAVQQASGGCSATAFTNVGAGFTGDPVIDFDPGGAMLQLCAPKARVYRGSLKFAMQGTKSRVVNFVATEDYLKGVVPSEMPSGWHREALKAQAVAARSYALAGDNRFPGFADTCDTIQCQVYLGFSNERATTNEAIDQTAGQVRVRDGAVARTEFSASTGGYTAGGTFPAVVDDGDAMAGNPHRNWSVTLPATQVEAAYPAIGDLQRIEVLERNGLGEDGGRVKRVRIVGAASSQELTGDAFRSRFGLKSDWFTPGLTLTRLAAEDRYATAAAIARSTFTSSRTALLARGDGAQSFADGLAANYLGGRLSAPTLLAEADALPAVTLAALKALGVQEVRMLGGQGALSDGVRAALESNGFAVERIAGADRFATAAALARAADPAGIGTLSSKRTAVLSSGRSFPDALAAAGVVYALHYPQLLTEPDRLPEATAAVLQELGIGHVLITGGSGAIGAAVDSALGALGITTERVQGATRYETAAVLADMAVNRLNFPIGSVVVATGESFPDALTGGAHAGRNRAPVLLTTSGSVPAPTCDFLRRRGPGIGSGHLFGGVGAVSDATKSALEVCLRS